MGKTVKVVAVIGAGVSGLATARELQQEGHRVVIFEKGDKLGGTWLYDSRVESDPIGQDPAREIVHTSLYRSLRTNIPRQLMGFLDYPFLKRENGDSRTFPGHEEVLWFLNKFADDFRIPELTRFSTEVVRIKRVDNGDDSNGGWIVESRTRGRDSVDREVFEAVVVCTGQNTEPRLAEIPGIEKWPGNQIHSHNYRVPEPFCGQIVALIGYGPSAFEISRDIATLAKEVHIATRSPDVKVSKLDNHDNIWQHKMIERVYDDGMVAFQDGSSVYADTIFYCTGYKYHYPFLDTNGIVTTNEGRVRPLYRHVFPPHLAPSLSFIGSSTRAAAFHTIDIQSKWVARVLSGKVLLPTEAEMMASVEEYYQQMEETGVPKRFTHSLFPKEVEYKNCLLAEIGLPPLEEWRQKLSAESAKYILAMQDGYRDHWDDDYWNAVIKGSHQDFACFCDSDLRFEKTLLIRASIKKHYANSVLRKTNNFLLRVSID